MNIRKIILLGACTLIMGAAEAQEKNKNEVKKVEIKTSAVCDMCKTTLEKGMAYEKGVKKSELDVKTKMLTVWYRADKTSEEKLRKAVTQIGYDADSLAADERAYERLDPCCKKGYHEE